MPASESLNLNGPVPTGDDVTIFALADDYAVGFTADALSDRLRVDLGVVTKSGAWFTYEGEQLGQGREKAKEHLRQNPVDDGDCLRRFKEDFVKLMTTFDRHEVAERELLMEVFWLEGGVSE